jgi:hypothetical protein
MLRKIWIFATLLAVISLGNSAKADVLVTGPVGFNNPNVFVPGGTQVPGNPVGPSGLATLAGSSGISFTNAWSNGAPAVGDKVTAIGFSLVSSFTMSDTGIGLTNFPTVVVGVFALEGQITQVGANGLTAAFTSGAVNLYNTGNPTVLGNNPSTWVPGGNVNAAPLASFTLTDPGAVVPGPGGAPVNLFAGNTAEVVFDNVNTDGDLLFDFVGAMDVMGDQFIEYLNSLNPGLHVNINELFQSVTAGEYGLDAADIAFLNSLFAALLGGSFTGDGPGEDFNPLGNGSNGDTIQTLSYEANFGNFVDNTEVPEPASLIVWSVMAAGGAGIGMIRRRRNQAQA